MMPLQIEVFIKCMSPLVGLFKSVCQSPDFHFTKPAFGLPIVCLSLHAFITWFSASRKLLIAFVLIEGNCSSYYTHCSFYSDLNFIKREAKKSPGNFNNSSSTL